MINHKNCDLKKYKDNKIDEIKTNHSRTDKC